jgi:hypothetical protein
LLSYYADMSRRRRAADRQSKRRVGVAKRLAASAPGRRFTIDRFSQVAEQLRLQQGIDCPLGCTEWEYHAQDETAKRVTIVCRCECGQVVRQIGLTREQFAEQAQAVLG